MLAAAPEKLYQNHVRERRARADAALAAAGFDAMIIDSGTPVTYFADDQDAPFRRTPHFSHWLPLDGPHHKLVVRAGARPNLVIVKPDDYWYEPIQLGSPFWAEHFDTAVVADDESAWREAAAGARWAYVGDDAGAARAHGFAENACNPPSLIARLDWDRSYKTEYEAACIAAATAASARGHEAARRAFLEGASELAIHQHYMQAAGCVDRELPYESIIALDEKGAFLHYVNKRNRGDGRVLLIDVGASHLGYGCDITRTWTAPECDPVFAALAAGMRTLQLELCARVKPGVHYLDLHLAAHRMIGDLLYQHGVIGVKGDEALSLGVTAPFFPHGLGHFLGIQVHDVAGRQRSPEGGVNAPPKEHPYLRTTRTIEEKMLFTVEPGLYFIEMLLKPHRTGPASRHFRWNMIDRLMPCGGIRIEDNVYVTAGGCRNLTRPHLPD